MVITRNSVRPGCWEGGLLVLKYGMEILQYIKYTAVECKKFNCQWSGVQTICGSVTKKGLAR